MFCKTREKRGAFTLVEVVLGVLILALLGSVLFTLVESTLGAASELGIKQNQTQEFNGLVEVCRQTFATMDSRSLFTSTVKPATGGGYAQEIRIENGPLAFAWQGSGVEEGITTAAPRPQANGLLAFCILQEITADETTNANANPAPTPPPKWFVLVRDLKKLEWRFYDPRAATWRKEWQETGFRPSLVELTIQSPASPDDTRIVFPMLAAVPQ